MEGKEAKETAEARLLRELQEELQLQAAIIDDTTAIATVRQNELAAKEAELSAAAAAHSSALAEKEEEIQALQQQLAQLSTSTTSTTSASSKPRAAEERASNTPICPTCECAEIEECEACEACDSCDGVFAELEAARDRATAAEENVGSLASEVLSCEAKAKWAKTAAASAKTSLAQCREALKKHSENKAAAAATAAAAAVHHSSPTSERTTTPSPVGASTPVCAPPQDKSVGSTSILSSVAWAYLLRLFCCGLLAVAYSAIAMGSSTGKY